MFNLLIEEGYPITIGAGEAAINALIGFATVFVGISILIAAVWLFGLIMSKIHSVKKPEPVIAENAAADLKEEDKDEIVAVICAAIAAIYGNKKKKPEFVVRDTKRNIRG